MAGNPELYQQMILSNPHLQSLLESNPELRRALSDPSTLQSILSAASNPAAYNEMLRGQDRALSNLENIPEGFSHLQRVYKTMQEPMYDAMQFKHPPPSSASTSNTDSSSVRKELTRDPVPNPWAPPTPTTKKRKLPSLDSLDDYSGFSGQLERMHGLGFEDDEGENLPALRATKGDLAAAIDWIMNRRHK